MSTQLSDLACRTIAELACALDAADRELFEFEKTGARLETRRARQRADELRAQLGDAIAAATDRKAVR